MRRYFKKTDITVIAIMAAMLFTNLAMAEQPKIDHDPMIMPEALSKVSPVYPEEAKQKGLEGVVSLAVIVDAEGKVTEVKVKESSGIEAMDKSAIKAAHKTRYKSALKNDQPVATWISYDVRFALGDKKEKVPTEAKYPASDDFVPVEQMPALIGSVEPEYPNEAIKKGIEGKVWIKALIDKKGKPVEVMVSKSSGTAMLDKAAKEAALQYRYKPAIQNSQSVAIWVTFAVSFTLDAQ